MKDELTARYKTYSVMQLLEVLENRNEYTPLAIQVAEQEWQDRQLSDEQVAHAKRELESHRLALAQSTDVLTAIGNQTARILAGVYRDIHPATYKTPEKAIVLICGFLALTLAVQVFFAFDLFLDMLHPTGTWDQTDVYWLLPFIFIPGTIYFFYKRSPAGWAMLSVWSTYIVTSSLFGYAYTFMYIEQNVFQESSDHMNGVESIFEVWTLSDYFFEILIFGGILYYINKRTIKELFRIKRTTPSICVAVTAIIVTIKWLPLFL